jgi:hypothetical protein
MATTKTALENIHDSLALFDLNAPLTEEELTAAGMLVVLPGARPEQAAEGMPLLKDIEENDAEPVDAVAAVIDGNSYNAQYARYLQCQALAALVAFDDGWRSFEEVVLKAYVSARKREDAEYRGSDPNTAFALRIKKQTAEDFVKFIHAVINEAVATPKPSLAVK